MKFILSIYFLLMMKLVFPQEIPDEEIGDQLEIIAENAEAEIEDDSWMEQLRALRIRKLNINVASEDELEQLLILSPIQISNLLRYRSLLGNLVHLNELQAVPGWNATVIRKLIPYITVEEYEFSSTKFLKRFRNGEKLFLVRASQVFERSDPGSGSLKYLGSPQKMLLKFQYNYGRLLQFGCLAEKDAGEQWMLAKGLDFNSFHLYTRDLGPIKRLALGDFLVNMGQGLIQWQGMSMKKSANVLLVKKQEEVIKPYRSAGEINFHRGLGFSLGKRNWEWTAFPSIRKLSANLFMDSLGGASITSFSNSGYHRTLGELGDRNNVKQFTIGSRLSYSFPNARIGLNFVRFKFSEPVQKKDDPYLLKSYYGSELSNWSVDYSYTFQNLHLFGELAVDHLLNKAFLNGLLVSLDQRLDLSLVFRSISQAYASMNTSAFTEASSPKNETGLYVGSSLRFSSRFRLDAYLDIFYFPWLRYTVDGPSIGRESVLQFSWQPNKRLACYTRWKFESKEGNLQSAIDPAVALVSMNKGSFRFHFNWECSRNMSISERVETSFYRTGSTTENGFLLFSDFHFHPPLKPYELSGRLLFFETDGYDSRVYAFEKDVLYSYSIPSFSGKGVNCYLNFEFKPLRWFRFSLKNPAGIVCWVRVANTFYSPGPIFFSDNVNPKRETNFSIQFLKRW